MIYQLAADFIVLLHFAFILFVVLGGFIVVHQRRVAWLHLPAVLWGMTVEFTGWMCPLTPWEQTLRIKAEQGSYRGDFIAHYLTSLIYPSGLTHRIQFILGLLVLIVNTGIYAWIVKRYHWPNG
jgi:hypothetical protein